MENLDLAITSETLPGIPAADDDWTIVDGGGGGGGGVLFSIGFRDQWCSCNIGHSFDEGPSRSSVQLYYAEYDDINIDGQYTYNTFVSRIEHPTFENQFDNNDIVVGSCNGLVCFLTPHFLIKDPVYICNPFTGEYVNLPKAIHYRKGLMVNGFGYHHLTHEYKVVRIYYPDTNPVGRVEVYTLGSGVGWRDKGEIPYSLFASSGILANGALHWLDYKEWKIVAFDLADEEFRLLPSPPCFPCLPYLPCFDSLVKPMPTTFYQLQVLGGSLCVVHHERGERVDIWSLKHEYPTWSWNKKFSIAWECLEEDADYEPFAITKSNEVLMWYNGTILSCYDPKTKTFKKLMDDDMGIEYFQAIPHVNSYVSLKALGEESKCLGEEDNRIR